MAGKLDDLSKFIYGTTRLGDGKLPFAERVKIARAAMETGVWFHTSHTYGDALRVLRTAFDEDRSRVPKLIFKIGWSKTPELREVIQQNLKPLGLESMDIGQLCLSGELAAQYASGGRVTRNFAASGPTGWCGDLSSRFFRGAALLRWRRCAAAGPMT